MQVGTILCGDVGIGRDDITIWVLASNWTKYLAKRLRNLQYLCLNSLASDCQCTGKRESTAYWGPLKVQMISATNGFKDRAHYMFWMSKVKTLRSDSADQQIIKATRRRQRVPLTRKQITNRTTFSPVRVLTAQLSQIPLDNSAGRVDTTCCT